MLHSTRADVRCSHGSGLRWFIYRLCALDVGILLQLRFLRARFAGDPIFSGLAGFEAYPVAQVAHFGLEGCYHGFSWARERLGRSVLGRYLISMVRVADDRSNRRRGCYTSCFGAV
jgi:hypothetical protein